MRKNAMYFPYISVPNNSWSIRTLLYWDKLSSIVPVEYIEAPEKLGYFMRNLVREGLVEQVFPAHYLGELPGFEECFKKLISYGGYKDFNVFGAFDGSSSLDSRVLMHLEKAGELSEFLVEKNVAELAGCGWLSVDRKVADFYMAYLVSCLGSIERIDAAPVTNQGRYMRMFDWVGGENPRKTNVVHHNKARDVVLNSLFPVPDGMIRLDDLLKFKNDYGHLLCSLRGEVEKECSVIAMMPNAIDRVDAVRTFCIKAAGQIEEVEVAMRSFWRRVAFVDLFPIIGAGFTAYASQNSDDLAYAGACFTVAACVNQVVTNAASKKHISSYSAPLAYVAHFNSSFRRSK